MPPHALAVVRELWQARDRIADARDTTPGRILHDAALVEIAMAAPQSVPDLKALRGLRGRGPRRFLSEWFDAVERGLALPEADLPTTSLRTDGPPPARAWSDKHPEAATRLARCRSVVVALSEEHDLPPENLVTQGYGEQDLKVDTQAENRENRRVTVRRITPLVKPVNTAQR